MSHGQRAQREFRSFVPYGDTAFRFYGRTRSTDLAMIRYCMTTVCRPLSSAYRLCGLCHIEWLYLAANRSGVSNQPSVTKKYLPTCQPELLLESIDRHCY
jgi:hypothetical protein